MDRSADKRELVISANYESFVLMLVLILLVNWVILLFLQPDPAQVLWIMNAGLITFLLADFLVRFWRHPQRWRFLWRDGGWMVLLGSLPVPFAAIMRVVWIWLTARWLRSNDYRKMRNIVVERRAQSTLLAAILAAIVVLEAGAVAVLWAEEVSSQANIETGIDALWWSIVTLSTVGYGDRYPVTTEGRVVGVVVIIAGVGLFSALTSFLAQWFLRARASGEATQATPSREVQELDRLSLLLLTYDVRRLLEDTTRPPDAVLAELRKKVAEINVQTP